MNSFEENKLLNRVITKIETIHNENIEENKENINESHNDNDNENYNKNVNNIDNNNYKDEKNNDKDDNNDKNNIHDKDDIWINYYGKLKYRGEYLNGKKWNGKGKEYYDNGN